MGIQMRHGLAFYIDRLARTSVPDDIFENDLTMTSYRLERKTTKIETENVSIALARSLTANKDVPERSARIADVCVKWISLGGSRMWLLTPAYEGLRSLLRSRIEGRSPHGAYPLEAFARLMTAILRDDLKAQAELNTKRLALLREGMAELDEDMAAGTLGLSTVLATIDLSKNPKVKLRD